MIYLYEMTSRTKIDQCNDELQIIHIIETMEEFYGENDSYRFMLVNYDPITTEPTLLAINSWEECQQYKSDYMIRHKKALELKKEIIDIKEMKKFTKK